ncbi:Ig-like domain repeat protein [Candidatus Poribacteria bacterium]|nr:Ig-like domain repeat protein [Candidatus Poribacteria bacterium]
MLKNKQILLSQKFLKTLSIQNLQIYSRLFIPILLFQLVLFGSLLGTPSLVWAQGFESQPRTFDDADEDSVFSPNGDGVQDNLIISFVTDGFLGDFRITIDVHGPAASGPPDGVFDVNDDWVFEGKVGPGRPNVQPPDDPKVIREEWDGRDRSPQQGTTPAPRVLDEGTYQIRVEIDAFQGNGANVGDLGYQFVTLSATIDKTPPQISVDLTLQNFSPNGDGIFDTTTISYTLSENLSELQLEFTSPSNQPAIALTQFTSGKHSFIWDGTDGLGTALRDAIYDLRLSGTDRAGNKKEIDIDNIRIDTEPPTITQVTPGNNTFQQTSISELVVTFDPGTGTGIDFSSSLTTITLTNASGAAIGGQLSNSGGNALRLTLDNLLDTVGENGVYTLTAKGADEAGNSVQSDPSFTFDTIAPTVTTLLTNSGELASKDLINTQLTTNTQLTFVEATITDNITDSLNLSASTIRLSGPRGAVLGDQSLIGTNGIRWTLRVPLATDGSDDGNYTITINAVDRAENSAGAEAIPFVYDTQAAKLLSLATGVGEQPLVFVADTIHFNGSLSQIIATFDDGSGSGLDFNATRIDMVKLEATGDETPVLGTSIPEADANRMTLQLAVPLANRDGTQDGTYRIDVTHPDLAGNSQTRQFNFIYDTQVPVVVTTAPAQNETISALSSVTVVLSDSTSTVDFGATSVRLLKQGAEIPTDISNNGADTIILTLSKPLATDGSDNDEYTIEIIPTDRAGNQAVLVQRRFFFTTQIPELRLNIPPSNVGVLSNVNDLTAIEAQLFDYIGAGIDFGISTIEVKRADGTVVNAKSVEADNANNRLIWTIETALARDGSADGQYTASVTYTDFAGRIFTSDFVLTFDTQLPTIASTTPADGARVSQLGAVVVKFGAELSGVDLAASQVQLLQPNGTAVGTNRSDNGIDQITLSVGVLPADLVSGVYTIEILPADRAGNIAGSPLQIGFTLTSREPTVTLLAPATPAFNQFNQITAALQNYVGPGIDFNRPETTIQVTNSTGQPIAAQSVGSNDVDQLTWTIATALPRDGSVDGTYAVDVSFVDRAGATFQNTFTLTFDSLPPTIVNTSPVAGARVSELNRIGVVLSDNPAGVDFANTAVRLVDAGNNAIPSTISNDGNQEIFLFFHPLKTDGSADGKYRIEITPVDLAGNVGGLSAVEFIYATQVPDIATLIPTNGEIVNRVSQIQATLIDNSGEGIDFDQSTITLKNADGTEILGVLRNDQQLLLTLEVALPTNGTADGVYTVELHLVDKLGVETDYIRQFTYDSQPPIITEESRPPEENRLTQNRVEVEFEVTDDPSGPNSEATVFKGGGVDFAATTVQLLSPDGTPVNGEQIDDGEKTITYTSAALPSVGTYSLIVTLVDRAGNQGIPQQFTYEILIDPPRVASIDPPNKARVNQLEQIIVKLEDGSGAGLDFSLNGSSIELRDSNNLIVEGVVTDNGVDEMTLTIKIPLLTDGGDDGVYTVIVQPVDRLGTTGLSRQFTITYDTQKPLIQSVTHVDLTANVSNVSDLITRVEAVMADSGVGIDFDQSSVELWKLMEGNGLAARSTVPGSLNHDNATKVWWQLETPLSRSGEDDGLYSIEVKALDKAGNIEEESFALRYDTQAPTVGVIQATATDGTTIDISTGTSPSLIEVPIHQLRLVFADASGLNPETTGSGINLLNTTVRLIRPDGTSVGANQQDNGVETVFLSFNPLRADGADDGRYTIQVTPTDLAGNTFTSPLEFQFFYGTQKPEVVDTIPAEFAFTPQLTSVSAQLLDGSGEGIDFEQSTIRLQAPDGVLIDGRQRGDEANSTITWELNQPPPRNGSADGRYTILLSIFDLASNHLDKESTFVYDTQIPQISSVVGNTTPETVISSEGLEVISQSLTEIAVTLSDAVGGDGQPIPASGVDFAGTAVQLLAPSNNTLGVNLRDDGATTLTVSFAQLREIGTYTLEITPRDLAGNVSGHAIEYRFSLSLARPRVASVTIGGRPPVAFVNRLDTITAQLVDVSGAGLDLTPDGSSIIVTGPNGVVDSDQEATGINTITWIPLELLTDGTADGRYTVTVTPQDSAGRSGIRAIHQFTFDTQEPDVINVSPINLSQPVSYIGQQFTQIVAQVADVGPANLEIAAQVIELRDSNGRIVPADLTNDNGSQIFLTLSQPLATDGSDDGEYTVIINLTDQAGNVNRIEHSLVYDTQAPTLVSTEPEDGSQILDELTVIEATLNDRGGSGIDFTTSQLTLLDPDGNPISGKPNNDGRGKLLLQTDVLETDGTYTIRVSAVDRAGNGVNTAFERSFLFSTSFPAVVKTVPTTSPAEDAFANAKIDQIEVEFQSNPNLSIATLLGPNGTTVIGQQSRDGDRLIYSLARELAQDGSDDGIYTIQVTPTNSAGRRGQPQQFTFVYDTVSPEVDANTITLQVEEPGVNNALIEVRATVTDDAPSSGIDWENLDESWLTLEKDGTNRKLRGTVVSDQQETLTFRLETPLASDGSQDGKYRVTVKPRDRAGNVSDDVVYEFSYDTRPPIIDSQTLLIDDEPLLLDVNHPDYPSAAGAGGSVVIQARLSDIGPDGESGLGVDLARSSITLRTPDGETIAGTLTQDGTDGILFKSAPLRGQGLYQVTITSVGLDAENLGFTPIDLLSTVFLYETKKPIAELTDFGGETTLTDEALPLRGRASDEPTDEIAASGVALVEIIGTGPDGNAIEPIPATDDSSAEEEPWSLWSLDFLPARSGEYNLDIRVTDRVGNSDVFDAVTVNFSVSLVFKGPTYVWPNPIRRSRGEVAHFAFDLNLPIGQGVDVTVSIYDFAGDMVYQKTETVPDVSLARSTDAPVKWNLKNQSGADVARGIYIFRLEAEDTVAKNRTNAVGKILVAE